MLQNTFKIESPLIKVVTLLTFVFVFILGAYFYIDRERIALSIINRNTVGIEVEARKISISVIPKFTVKLDGVTGKKVDEDNFYLFELPDANLEMPLFELFPIFFGFPDSGIPKNISISNDSKASIIPNNTQSEKDSSRIWKGLKFNASTIDVSWTDTLTIKMAGEIYPNESSHLLHLQGEILIKRGEISSINLSIQNSRDLSDTLMIVGKISPDLALRFKSKLGNINDWGLDFFNLGPIRASGEISGKFESPALSNGLLYLGDGENNGIQIKGKIDDKQSCEFDLEGGGANIAKLFLKPINKVDLNGMGFHIKANLNSNADCITNLNLAGNLNFSNFNLANIDRDFTKGIIGIQANFSSSASNWNWDLNKLRNELSKNLSGNGYLKLKADLNVARINSSIRKEIMSKADVMKDTLSTVIPILPANDNFFRCTYTTFTIDKGVMLSGDNDKYPWVFQTDSLIINSDAELDLNSLSYSLHNKVAMGSSSNWGSLKGDFFLKGYWGSRPDIHHSGFEKYLEVQVIRKELANNKNKDVRRENGIIKALIDASGKIIGEVGCGIGKCIPQNPREGMRSCL